MKKRGRPTKVFGPEMRPFVVTALCEGYSINVIMRATGVPERQVIRWRDEEGIEPILSTNSMRRKLPELVFNP